MTERIHPLRPKKIIQTLGLNLNIWVWFFMEQSSIYEIWNKEQCVHMAERIFILYIVRTNSSTSLIYITQTRIIVREP